MDWPMTLMQLLACHLRRWKPGSGATSGALKAIPWRLRPSRPKWLRSTFCDHDVPDAEQSDGHHDAMIIAESEAELKTMTVSMAVMQLDLTESQAVVFRNAAHGGLAVVYRRSDGHIGWIDPQRTQTH